MADSIDATVTFVTRTRCPACHGLRIRRVFSCPFSEHPIRTYMDANRFDRQVDYRYLEGHQYVLEECVSCGLIFQRHIPNERLMAKIYGDWASGRPDDEERFDRAALQRCTQFVADFARLVAFTGKRPSSLRVLDFGMGRGDWIHIVTAFRCDVVGTDLSVSRMAAAGSSINVIPLDDIRTESFDIIHANQVFEHLAEPLETARRLARALKPTGLLHIAVPNGHDIKRRIRRGEWTASRSSRHYLNPVSPLQHVNCFNHRALTTMAAGAGLDLVHIPLRLQYRFVPELQPLTPMVTALARPLLFKLRPISTDLIFRRAQPASG